MILRDTIDISLDNLRQARLRTVLTTLGVAIGVGSIVGMLAIAVGLQDNLYAQLLKTGFFRRITVFVQFGREQAARQLDDAAMTAIGQIPGVKSVSRDIRMPARLEINGKRASLSISGVAPDDADEAVFAEIRTGRFFSSNGAREVIVNSLTAKSLGFDNPAGILGKVLRVTITPSFAGRALAAMPGISPEQFPVPPPFEVTVAGVVERERALFGEMNARLAYVPQKLAEEQVDFFRKNIPVLAAMALATAPVQVRLADVRDVDRVEKEIKTLGFRTISISSIIANMRRVFIVVDMLLALIGSMALAVASLGIINTMVMAVLERTREIGVMKAVGAEDGDVRRVFITESAIIGGLGGLAGLLLAWALGRAVNWGANIYIVRQGFRPETLFHIPLWLVASALGFALLVSVASGLYPAARAARIDPARALRHD